MSKPEAVIVNRAQGKQRKVSVSPLARVWNGMGALAGQWQALAARVVALESRAPKNDVGVADALLDANGHLVLTFTDGRALNLGKVKGEDGVSPEPPKFDPPKPGENGVGVADALLDANGHLVLTFTDGRALNLGKVKGEDGVSPEPPKFDPPKPGENGVGVADALLDANGHLVLTFTDGRALNLGKVKGEDGVSPEPPKFDPPKPGENGVGVADALLDANGHLVLTFTDGRALNLGKVKGEDGVSPEPPKFDPPKPGENGVGVADALLDANGHLVLTFTDGRALNLGKVKGEDGVSPEPPKFDPPKPGENGVGVADALLDANGHLVLTFTDGRALNLGKVKGEDGVSPEPPKFDPPKPGENGVGVADALLDANGHLVLTFTDGRALNLGKVKGEDGVSPEPPKFDPPKDGVSVVNAEIRDDRLIIVLSDDREIDAGTAVREGKPGPSVKGDRGVGVAKAEIAGTSLVLHMTDGTKQSVGRVVGRDAPPPPLEPNVPLIEIGEDYPADMSPQDVRDLRIRDLTIEGSTYQVLCRS